MEQGITLGPANIYPLLAAWLIATTNGDQAGDFKIPESLGTVAGLGPTSYNYIFNTFFPSILSYRPAFTKVRTAFQLVATHFASYAPLNPITNPYGGGICPDKASVVQAVASLPCAVSNPPPSSKGWRSVGMVTNPLTESKKGRAAGPGVDVGVGPGTSRSCQAKPQADVREACASWRQAVPCIASVFALHAR